MRGVQGDRLQRSRIVLSACCLLLLLSASGVRSDPVAELLADPTFDAVFHDYVSALDGFGAADLSLELNDSIEDALLGGSFLSRPGLGRQRAEIGDALMSTARVALCSQGAPATQASVGPGSEPVRRACAEGALAARRVGGEALDAGDLGMLAAVCARLVTTPSVARWCASP